MNPLCSLVLLTSVVLPMLGQSPARLRAGAAKVDISPNQSQFTVSKDSIRDRLFARVILVDDGASCAGMVAIDGGVRNNVLDPAITKSTVSTQCPTENCIVSGTRSRSASTGRPGGAGVPDAASYIKELFDNRTIALFSQAAFGDENPRLAFSPSFFMRTRPYLLDGRHPIPQTVGPQPPPAPAGEKCALAIDTDTGFYDRKVLIELLTKLPYDVVATHGHPDHAGGVGELDELHMGVSGERGPRP